MKKFIFFLITAVLLLSVLGCETMHSPQQIEHQNTPTEEIQAEILQGQWFGLLTGAENTEYLVDLVLNKDGSFHYTESEAGSSAQALIQLKGTWSIVGNDLILNIDANDQSATVISEDSEIIFSYYQQTDELILEQHKKKFSLTRKEAGTEQ